MEKQKEFHFNSLPDDVIIKILELVIESSISDISNIGSIKLLNLIIERDPIKVRIVDFLDTALWIRLLINIGIVDNNPESKMCDTIKTYIRPYITEGRYTSRAHDLLEIVRSPIESDSVKEWARYLLNNLITGKSTLTDYEFLTGNMTNIPILTDDTIADLLQRLIEDKGVKLIKYWDVRNVTMMRNLFTSLHTYTGLIDLTFWDTRKVTDMSKLFWYKRFSIRGVTNWNTCNVTNMEELFIGSYIHAPLEWNTSKVTNMERMFSKTIDFDELLLWDTRKVTNMRAMFEEANRFNQPLMWNTSKVINMARLFHSATVFNQELKWDTSKVKYMSEMFFNATSFDKPLKWDTSNVIDMASMFGYARSFNQLLEWDTSKVVTMRSMFNMATSFDQPLKWDTSEVLDMGSMFSHARSFNRALKWESIRKDAITWDMFNETRGGRWDDKLRYKPAVSESFIYRPEGRRVPEGRRRVLEGYGYDDS